jgi:hypothetical protein
MLLAASLRVPDPQYTNIRSFMWLWPSALVIHAYRLSKAVAPYTPPLGGVIATLIAPTMCPASYYPDEVPASLTSIITVFGLELL